jgi:hypothetical protein
MSMSNEAQGPAVIKPLENSDLLLPARTRSSVRPPPLPSVHCPLYYNAYGPPPHARTQSSVVRVVAARADTRSCALPVLKPPIAEMPPRLDGGLDGLCGLSVVGRAHLGTCWLVCFTFHGCAVCYTKGKTRTKSVGEAGYRSLCLSHAKRALYHLSYIPEKGGSPAGN